jgi:signal transduction histidine kinase
VDFLLSLPPIVVDLLPRTEFVTNISHEIRTPIAAVIEICELLLDDSTLMEGHRSLVEKSLRSGQILLELIGMVLVRLSPRLKTSI